MRNGCQIPISAALVLLVSMLLGEGVSSEERAVKPLVKPIILIAHRGGKPDNTIEAIEHSVQVGVTAVEIDVRATTDGRLVLSHDASLPRSKFVPGASADEKIVIAKTPFETLSALRYAEDVKGKHFAGLRIPSLDEVMEKCLPRVNLDLHVARDTPLELVIAMIEKHCAWDRVLIHSPEIDRLTQVRAANPRVGFLWPQSLLGRHEVDGKWVALPLDEQKKAFGGALERFSEVGGGILCTKVFSPELVALCHGQGVLTMPSSYQVKDGTGERWLRMGVDCLMGDCPEQMRKGVERVLGPEYLPTGNPNIADLLRQARARR